jgi:hypothetical protein
METQRRVLPTGDRVGAASPAGRRGGGRDARDEVGEIGFAPQVIVSQALARGTGGQDAVGKRIRGGSERWSSRVILYDGLPPGLVGIAAGVLASSAVVRVLSTMLFGVHPHDPVTWLTVTAAMIATYVMASYIPARRATRVQLIEALRQ